MAFNIGYISVNRLFPTRVQATVYAVVNLAAHLIACLAPLTAEVQMPIPFMVFLACVGISFMVSQMLSELGEKKESEEITQTKTKE